MKVLLPFLVTLGLVFSLSSAKAQQPAGNARISGFVKDSTNNQVVEFANVVLVSPATGKPVNGAVCDEKGKFSITKVSVGTYSIQVSFIGFETKTIANIKITEKRNDYELGIIKVSPTVKVLSEVVVQGQKDLVEERVDRTIYNAENDATTRGGDATDVLKRVPMLSVDLDGNVSMRGSQNVTVLINNKPSTIMANSIADALKQIPSDQIKTVEVITSPSARYDAEGSAGIINIITKKNTLEGLTLNVDAGVGYRGSNLGLNGNYRKGKMGFSLGGFGRANYNIDGSFENSQLTSTVNSQTQLTSNVLSVQRADNRSNGIFGNYNLGWDYDINKKNSLAASVRYGVRNNNSFQDKLITQRFINGIEGQSSLRDVESTDQSGTVDVNLSYTKLFDKPQRELSFLALYSRNDRNNDFANINYSLPSESIANRIKNVNDGLNEETTLQIDYQTPVGDQQMFEMGAKDIRRKVISDFSLFTALGATGTFIPSPSQNLSNQLNYNQDVLSAYVSHTYAAKNGYSLKSGVRYEYTTITAFSRTEADIDIPEYGVLVPSINASKKLKKGTIKTSYNRRIQRPSIQFLNPNIQNANPLSETIGNPRLDPEFTNNFEVGYSTFIKGTSLNFTGFVRNSNNAIQSFRQTVRDSVIQTTYANIGQENAYGMSFFSNINFGKLSLNGGGDVFYADLANNVSDPTQQAANTGWVYSGRVFGSYDLGNGWALQTFSFYRGRRVQLQGYQGGIGTYSLGARKEFKNKKGSVGIGLENFLAPSMKIRNAVQTTLIDQNSVTVLNNFSFRFNVSYRIGKMSFDQGSRRRGKSINNDDLKEGDGGGDGGGGMMSGGGAPGGQRGGPPRTAVAPASPVPVAKTDPTAVVVAEGTWTYTIESPQGGNGTVVIRKDGSIYSGVISNTRTKRETNLKSVSVNGNEMTLVYEMSFGGNTAEISIKGVIKENQFEGSMSFGQFGAFPFKATRN